MLCSQVDWNFYSSMQVYSMHDPENVSVTYCGKIFGITKEIGTFNRFFMWNNKKYWDFFFFFSDGNLCKDTDLLSSFFRVLQKKIKYIFHFWKNNKKEIWLKETSFFFLSSWVYKKIIFWLCSLRPSRQCVGKSYFSLNYNDLV